MSLQSLRRRSPFALVALLLAAPSLHAQSVADILAKHNKAVDPQGRIATVVGMKMNATLEMPAMGVSAPLIGVSKYPNQSAVTITIPGMGEMKQGYDGTVAWASDPMQGPRILKDAEAAALADAAGPRTLVRTADQFSSSEVVGEVDVEGEKCVRVKHTWKSARVTTDCYSVATGHVIESLGKQSGPQGEMETQSRFSDFRAAGGFVMPHKTIVNVMGMQQIVTTTSVEFGEQSAASVELPAEIKALKKP